MSVTEISLFLENVEGQLYRVSSLLGESNINIRAITIADSEGVGVLRIVVDKPTNAMNILKRNGFIAQSTDVLALSVEDKPGGLAGILKVLSDNKLNVQYMYGFIEKSLNKAMVAVRFDDLERATNVLHESKIPFI